MDAIMDLVDSIYQLEYEGLPASTVDITKKFVLDSLGCVVAGTTGSGCQEVYHLVREWGGKEESSIFVYGDRVPSFMAALINGMMAHSREIDDTHDVAFMHTFTSILFASLAAAECRGRISGKELITAVVSGVDLSCRIALSTERLGWATLWPSFGSAAACAKLLGFTKGKILDTIGIVLSQATGNIQCAADGALVKRMQHGFAAMRGVLSASLAEAGITGTRNVLEGKYGFFQLYKRGKYDRERLLADLGKKFEVDNLSIKPYPSCRCTHGPIDLTLKIREKYEVNAEEVEEVTVYLSKICFDVVGKTFILGRNPQVDAQFSVPYNVAVALMKGDVWIDDFEETEIRDPSILKLAEKVHVEVYEGIGERAYLTPVRLEVRMKKGEIYSERADFIKGDPQNPMNFEELTFKFRKCIPYSAKLIPHFRVEEVIELVRNFEKLDNCTIITDFLRIQ